MSDCPFKVNDLVRIVVLHDFLRTAPAETVAIYQNAFMRPLRVDGIDRNGSEVWVELNVNADGSQASDYGAHTLCVTPEELELVESGPSA